MSVGSRNFGSSVTRSWLRANPRAPRHARRGRNARSRPVRPASQMKFAPAWARAGTSPGDGTSTREKGGNTDGPTTTPNRRPRHTGTRSRGPNRASRRPIRLHTSRSVRPEYLATWEMCDGTPLPRRSLAPNPWKWGTGRGEQHRHFPVTVYSHCPSAEVGVQVCRSGPVGKRCASAGAGRSKSWHRGHNR